MNKPISPTRYDLLTILLHWISAAAMLGLFALGVWMVELGYYHSWYNRAPDVHRSVGVLLTLLVLVRLVWRQAVALPEAPATHKPWERISGRVAHVLLYLLLLLVCFSGYFISSAEGQAVDVFNWFSVPALVSNTENLEDTSGLIHKIAAYIIIALTAVHACAALKHHFIDRDDTLLRMLRR